MATPQGGLQPLIGYAMHALGRAGATVERVIAQMERIAPERGWPASLIYEAIGWAQSNLAMSTAARVGQQDRSIVDLTGRVFGAEEAIGVRVVLTIYVDNPPQPAHYETVSIVVNVDPSLSPAEILARASDLWLQHADKNRYGTPVIDVAASPGIVGLFEGGLEGAYILP